MLPSWHNFIKWLNRSGKPGQRGRKNRTRPRPSHRPALEQLEDRLVPTMLSIPAFNVNNLAPSNGQGGRGGFVLVPILIDKLDDSDPGSNQGENQVGVGGGSFVINYDTKVFQQLTAQNVQLGVLNLPGGSGVDNAYSTTNGWTVSLVSSLPSGNANITITPPGSGNILTADSGSLVILNLQVLPSAPLGVTRIDLAADTGGTSGGVPNPPTTSLSDGTDDLAPGQLYLLVPNPNSNAALANPLFPQNGPTDNTGDIQTITFGGTINAGTTFELGLNGVTTAPISYSTTPATLQSNIQTALDAITTFPGDTLVVANSATSVTVTFQGELGSNVPPPGGQILMTWTSQLTGTNASLSVGDSGFGYYGLANDTAYADPTDGSVNITGTNAAPTANNDANSISERDVGTDPGLAVTSGNLSLLSNDFSPVGNLLLAKLVTGTSHGTVVVNGDQTITFSGLVNGDTFQLLYANFTTAPIAYSTAPATLQSRIQSALSSLVTTAPITGFGTPVVTATNNTTVAVTFNTGATSVTEPPISVFASTLASGTASINVASQGSYTYSPVTGYLGPDSFTYQTTDPGSGGGLTGNTATVNLTVSPRLSIPGPVISGGVGTTITVPVMLDNPNPSGSGGLNGAQQAITFDPTVLQETNVVLGTVTSNANAVQTITFGNGITNGNSFVLVYTNNATGVTQTTSPIVYSTTPATLQTNIQGALNGLTATGSLGSGNTLVTALSATTVTVAFQGTQNNRFQNTLTSNGNPQVIVATTTGGVAAFNISTPQVNNAQGLLALAETAGTGGPNLNTIGGTLINIIFTVVNPTASGVTPIYFAQALAPSGIQVPTALSVTNSSYLGLGGVLPVRPPVSSPTTPTNSNVPFAQFVAGVDGFATSGITGAFFTITGTPTSVSAGTSFNFTVTAFSSPGVVNTGYAGQVQILSSDTSATLPPSASLTNGVGTFTATLASGPRQLVYARDTVTTALDGASSSISVIGSAVVQQDHFVLSAPASATAGSQFTITVTAETSGNAIDTGYKGIIQFTTSDGQGVLSGNATLTNGQGIFSATLKTAATQTLTVADTVSTTITAATATITVVAAPATHFTVSAPGTATAGVGIAFTVTAFDQFNNLATGYGGSVAFSSSDTGSSTLVPANSTLTNGTRIFSATLTTAGNQTLTATDSAASSINGHSGTITVSAVAATHFAVNAPGAATAGVGLAFTVTALDPFNNKATSYGGSVVFTSTDGGASTLLPGNSTLANGAGTFSATLTTAGTQTLIATDSTTSSINGHSGPITVSAAAASHFTVSAPGTATAGVGIGLTVTAFDAFNNLATTYGGTVAFSNSAAGATLPASSTLTNGSGTFSATLTSAVTQTITATDSTTTSITGHSGPITVSAAAASHFAVSAPGSATAGNGFAFTVTALDRFNNTATGYAGMVVFSSSDGGATAPANSSLTNGTGTFSATLTTAGNQTLTATDSATSSITGHSGPINVSAAAATHYTVSAPSAATAGTGFAFTVTALDRFNNTATGYGGTVVFSSSDAGASTRLPANSPLSNGLGIFSATLTTAANQTLTATDATTSSITGHSGSIIVSPAAATHYGLGTPSSTPAGAGFAFTVTALDPFNNTATGYAGTVVFSSSDAGATVPANSTLSGGTGTFNATLATLGNQTLTATDTATTTITGHSSILVTQPANLRFVVNSPAAATAGAAFAFTVTIEDNSNNTFTGYTGTVVFSSSDGGAQALVPANATLSNGVGTFSATLTTAGSQTLTATDKTTSSIFGHSGAIIVSASTATHYTVSSPSVSTAGAAIPFTVTALDGFNNTATGYTGSVAFTSTDVGAFTVLPANAPLTSGFGTFSATLTTAGSQTLTATDTTTGTITGHSGPITVSPVAASHYKVIVPGTATAGLGILLTIRAYDSFNNVATGYLGTVTFASSDHGPSTTLPAPSTLAAGQGIFSVTLTTSGNQTVTATDSTASTLTGFSGPTLVIPGLAVRYSIPDPPATTAGVSLRFTISALDQFNNVATGYVGTINFTSSDHGPSTTLPAPSTLSAGQGIFSITLTTSGNQTVTATDSAASTLTGFGGPIFVIPGLAVRYSLPEPPLTTAGVSIRFTVSALDQFNNIATGYVGTINFTSSDHGSSTTLPAPSTLAAGQGIFSLTLTTSGNQTVTATDSSASTLTGIGGPIFVIPGAATHFKMSAPSAATAGAGFAFTVTAQDQFNNTATAYGGTVQFGSSDTAATVPGNSTLGSGTGTFTATLKTAGNQTLSATDTTTGSINGFVFGPIFVGPAPVSGFRLNVPPTGISGIGFLLSVTAFDPFNNKATGYTGTVQFSSSDTRATVPANSTLSNGTGTFSATLTTTGSQTLTATDSVTSSIAGHSSPIIVSAAAASHFVVTAPSAVLANISFNFTVTALDQFNNVTPNYTGTVAFTASDHSTGVVLPPDATLTNGTGTFSATLQAAGTDATITATDTVNATVTGSSNAITVIASAASSFVVTAPATTTAGVNTLFTVTAQTTANQTATNYSGTVVFTSSDTAGVFTPTQATLTSGVGVFSVQLKTAGNQSLTASDKSLSSINGSTTIVVNPAAASHFLISGAPGTIAAGTPFGFTVTALDPFNNTTVGYAGTVRFASNDTAATLPANTTLAAGAGTFSATLVSAGSRTLTAVDTVTSSVAGTATVTVTPLAATHFLVSAPSTATAGVGIVWRVTAEDRFNNTAPSYAGTIHFTSSDNKATLPGNSTLVNGTGLFAGQFGTAGNQTLTATDVAVSSITGASNPVAVSAGAATHLVVSAASGVAAGTPFRFTVTAEDSFNNTAPTYTGTVKFSTNDTKATLPANSTLTAGTGTFSATLVTSGIRTLTAADTVTSSIAGKSTITVTAGSATHFLISAPANATAGNSLIFTVTAEDQFNNTAAGYAGTVNFTSSDSQASLPANATLNNGSGLLIGTLGTAGNQTISATDVSSNSISGTSNTIAVVAGPATQFAVAGAATVTAGVPFSFTVTAQDSFNNTVPGYAGTVTFSSSDNNATLPANSTLTAGTGVFSATLVSSGSQSVTATDSADNSITGAATFNVVSLAATHFLVIAPPSTTAGDVFVWTVTALDQFNGTVTSYAGTVHFTSSDSQAELGPDTVLTSGSGVFAALLGTAGSQTLSATDTQTSSITGASDPILVNAGPATQLILSATPSTVTAGNAFSLTVTAEDSFNNIATGYTGTIALSSTDSAAAFVPASSTLAAGVGSFSVTLKTAGISTVTANDPVTSGLTATTNPINVSPAAATHFVVAAPAAATAGVGFSFNVTAEDQFNNLATAYGGTVAFTSSDHGPSTALPANSTLAAGQGVFSVTLTTAGNQTLTATDTASSTLNGTSSPIAVSAAAATHFTLNAPAAATAGVALGFTVTALDQFNNTARGYTGTTAFSSSDQGNSTSLPANSTLAAGAGAFSATLTTSGSQTLTVADATSGSIAPGVSGPIDVSPAATSHFAVSAPGSATAGAGLQFTVTALDAFNNTTPAYAGTVVYSSSDSRATVPANSTLSNGGGTFSATLTTAGSQTLTATDAAAASITGRSGPIVVSPATASHYSISAPGSATAGAGFKFTVTALDPFNNTDTGYSGTASFSSTDTGSSTILPANSPLAAGIGTFSATLTTSGTQTISALDTVSALIAGNSNPINVSPASATHYGVSSPTTATAGAGFTFTVTALDQFNNTSTGYTGTASFSSTDNGLSTSLPANSTLAAGTSTFSATLTTSGSQTISALDTVTALIAGNSNPINVSPAPATHYGVNAPSAATAGAGFQFTVTALDPFNNTDTGYTGTTSFSSNDAGASTKLPANSTLSAGVGAFSATLTTAGTRTLAALDAAAASVFGNSGPISVSPAPASHFGVGAPGTATAGTGFQFTVTALDPFNNTDTGYTGTASFSSSDNGLSTSLPGNSSLTNGTGTFSATLTTAGSQTLTTTDTATASITGHGGPIIVSPAAASHYLISAPGSATAGAGFQFTVTALDPFNNTDTGYSGTASFFSSDNGASTLLPPNSSLAAGTGTFSATLTTSGSQTISAVDTVVASILGKTNQINVSPAAATHYGVNAPVSATAGTGFKFTITALDPFNNTATGYTGTASISSTDSGASTKLPAASTLSSGVGNFSATLTTSGSQTLSAVDATSSSIVGNSGPINVSPASASHFALRAPAVATAGTGFAFTVTALDPFNNTDTAYAGTTKFSSSDTNSASKLPANTTLSAGTGSFSATLTTAGSQTLTAADATSVSIAPGVSGPILVSAAAASHFSVSAPGTATAGAGFNFIVTALDRFNNTATAYTGTAAFSSSDTGQATTLPASSTLSAGVGNFSATLTTSGNQTLTATDVATATITGTSSTIAVSAAAATHLVFNGIPSSTTAGVRITFTVAAEDAFNNIATGYSGGVAVSSSDTAAVFVPASKTFTSGLGTFSVTLRTAGNQTLTATDTHTSTITGTSNTITVSPAGATHLALGAVPNSVTAGTAFSLTVTAQDAFNNTASGYTGTIAVTSTDTTAGIVPASSTLAGGTGTFSVALKKVGSWTVTAKDPVTTSLTATAGPIGVAAAPASHFAFSGVPTTVTSGTGFNFTVTALDPFNNTASGYSGTVALSSSDSAATFVPAAGILLGGVGGFSANLKTAGNQTLTAQDTVTASITGVSGAINVIAAVPTHFVITGTPSSVSAGAAFTFAVTAEDAFNNAVPGYTGTVVFSSSDPGATLPANTTLAGGTGNFSATLVAAGSQSITVADSVMSSISGSATITVTPLAATHLLVAAPASVQAGQLFIFTVTARDRFNNTATSYSGMVSFTSSDTQAGMGGPSPLSNGSSVFAALLKTAGSQTITATDTVVSSITGSSNAITVNPAAPNHLAVGAPASAAAGTSFTFTVTAQDQFNNTVANYGGSVHFTSSDSRAVLPGNKTLTAGVGTFSATLLTSGSQNLTAIDTVAGGVNGSGSIQVNAATATHFLVSAPVNATAGAGFAFTVTAQDQFNNTAAGYTGTVHFSSGDTQAGLPVDSVLNSGIGNFVAILRTAGNQTITASDLSAGTITGTSNAIAVATAAATHFAVTPVLPVYPGITSGPNSFATTGLPTTFTVMALDNFGNTIPGYTGTVHFTSSDTGASLPANSTLAAGVGTFSATLRTPGSQTITATDTVSAFTGTSTAFATRGLVVTSYTTTPGGFTVTFNKPFNTSTVNLFTAAALPDDVILATTGSQISVRGSVVFNPSGFTFVKTASITSLGTFNPASGLLSAGTYTVTLRSFSDGSSGFQDALGGLLDGNNSGVPGSNFKVTFAVAAAPVAVGIPDFARGFSNTDALFFSNTLTNGSTFALSYTNPAVNPQTGTATVTFSTTAATLASNIQTALSTGGLATQVGFTGSTPNAVVVVTNDVSSGANVLVTFQSGLAQATNQLLASSTPGVSISLATINVANNVPGNGIPIALSSGLGVTSGTFTLQYNPNLLTISSVVSKIAGASFTLVSNDTVNGIAVLSLSSPSSISSTAGAITLGSLLATVPLSSTASYGAKQLLHFSNEQLNGTAGTIPVTNQDGVEVAAYFGDVTDVGGPFNLNDVAAISAVANAIPNTLTLTIPGFAPFSTVDPVIVGDVSLQGIVNSTDAGAMLQQVGGTARITIPYAPIGIPITPAGPSALFVGLAVQPELPTAGSTLIVAANNDAAQPQSSTVTSLLAAPRILTNAATTRKKGFDFLSEI